MAKSDMLHWVRWVVPGMGTLTYQGTDFDRGQLIELRGARLDDALLRQGQIAELKREDRHRITQCGVCGAKFIDDRFLGQHGQRRHKGRFDDLELTPGMQSPRGEIAGVRDITGDAEERQLMAEAPLYLENTKASQR